MCFGSPNIVVDLPYSHKMNRFLIIFVAVLGLSLAEEISIKQNLLQGLKTNERVIIEKINYFYSSGYDYFGERLNRTLTHVLSVRADVEKMPDDTAWKDAAQWIAPCIVINRELPGLMRYPAKNETIKSDALYLSVIKPLQRDSSLPTPQVLQKQVTDVVIVEGFVTALNYISNNVSEIQKAQDNLDHMYDVLVNLVFQKENKLPTPTDLKGYESKVEDKKQELIKKGKQEEADKLEAANRKWMAVNYQIGKIFPLDSYTRLNEYLVAAPEFYRAFQHVEDIILYMSIDCSNNHCKKHDRTTE